MSDRLEIGGWFGATWARHAEGREVDATILNGAVTLAFPDLLKEGSLGGIVVGVPPKLTDIGNGNSDSDTSLHIQAFCRLQIIDNIYINPVCSRLLIQTIIVITTLFGRLH